MTDLRDNEHVTSFREVIKLGWPASLSMLSNTLIKFVDGWMVSRVGPAQFSAQFYGGMMAFVPESFLLGTLTVINTHVSQNFGLGRYRHCSRYAWAAIAVVIAFSAVVCPLALAGRGIFEMLGHEEAAYEALYFAYMVLSIPLTLSIRSIEQFFWGIHRSKIVLVGAVVGNLYNVGANYVLIFGKLGFPAMGLKGAAIGSVTAWTLQLALLMAVFLSRRLHAKFGTRLFRSVRWRQCSDILRVGWPAGLQFFIDMFGWSFGITILAGTFGLAHRFATTAVMRYMQVSFMPAVGIGIATTAIVGKVIGQQSAHLARRRAHAGVMVACAYMGACGLAFLLFRHAMVDFFLKISHMTDPTVSADDVIRIGGRVMICAAVFQLFDAVAIVYGGALRGAGDTLWPMCVTAVLTLTVIFGGGYLFVTYLPSWQSIGPWAALGKRKRPVPPVTLPEVP